MQAETRSDRPGFCRPSRKPVQGASVLMAPCCDSGRERVRLRRRPPPWRPRCSTFAESRPTLICRREVCCTTGTGVSAGCRLQACLAVRLPACIPALRSCRSNNCRRPPRQRHRLGWSDSEVRRPPGPPCYWQQGYEMAPWVTSHATVESLTREILCYFRWHLKKLRSGQRSPDPC